MYLDPDRKAESLRRTDERNDLITTSQPDKYALYVAAFQEPTTEVALLRHLYEQRNGVCPRSLREDFCGTAAVAREWVLSDADASAVAVDHDREPLAWASARWQHEARMQERSRLRFILTDVLSAPSGPVDVICALNGSFCALKSRRTLVDYLTRCRAALASPGLLVLNVYTGPDAQRIGSDLIPLGSCSCVWEQSEFDPATHRTLNYVHFELADGSRLERAFTYDWRLWTPPELQDALEGAGFGDISVHIVEDRAELLTGRCDGNLCQADCWEAYVVAFL